LVYFYVVAGTVCKSSADDATSKIEFILIFEENNVERYTISSLFED